MYGYKNIYIYIYIFFFLHSCHPVLLRNEITAEKLKDFLFFHKNLFQLKLYEEDQEYKIQPRIFIKKTKTTEHKMQRQAYFFPADIIGDYLHR
jgi:hypothetical protein